VAGNEVKEEDKGIKRDEVSISYERDDGKISFLGPKRHFDDFRADDAALVTLRERHL
jgi:hypothetical protein